MITNRPARSHRSVRATDRPGTSERRREHDAEHDRHAGSAERRIAICLDRASNAGGGASSRTRSSDRTRLTSASNPMRPNRRRRTRLPSTGSSRPRSTRALVGGILPTATGDMIEQRAKVRMARQQPLARQGPVKLWALLDESVLRSQVGGPMVCGPNWSTSSVSW
jgi:hypothetical protein